MNSKVGIVVPVMTNFEGALKMLASVQTGRAWTPYIIPNWEHNRGVSYSWNAGRDRAVADGCDYILIVNDDILFSPQTIDKLCEHLDSRPTCMLVSACNLRDQLPDPQMILGYQVDPEVEPQIGEGPDFSCFMIRPETFDTIGRFDEHFTPAYFEDNDYHYRIKLSEFEAHATTAAPFYHFGSVTQNSVESGVVPSGLFENNRNYYASKWGGVPGAEVFQKPFNNRQSHWSTT